MDKRLEAKRQRNIWQLEGHRVQGQNRLCTSISATSIRRAARDRQLQAGRDSLRRAHASVDVLRRALQNARRTARLVESHQSRLLHSTLHSPAHSAYKPACLSATKAHVSQLGRLQFNGEQRLCQTAQHKWHRANRARLEDGRRLGVVQSHV